MTSTMLAATALTNKLELFEKCLQSDVRLDGRNFSDYRVSSIKRNVLKTQINLSGQRIYGSAQVQIGGTIVIAGVLLMVGLPSLQHPGSGDIGSRRLFFT